VGARAVYELKKSRMKKRVGTKKNSEEIGIDIHS
jgi:hypothetical protein